MTEKKEGLTADEWRAMQGRASDLRAEYRAIAGQRYDLDRKAMQVRKEIEAIEACLDRHRPAKPAF